MYLLFRLLQKHPTDAILYRHGTANPGFFLHYNGKTWWHPNIRDAFGPLTLKLLTNDGSRPIWAVQDGEAAIPTGTNEVWQIVLITPRMQRDPTVDELLKSPGSTLLVNPPWSFDDIATVRELAFNNSVDRDDILESFDHWGGNPRICLDWVNSPMKQQKLKHALELASPDKYFRQAGLVDIEYETASDFIFHVLPGQSGIPDGVADDDPTLEFSYPAFCWATGWVQDRIWEEMKHTAGERSMLKFMVDTDRNNLAARAFAFEPHVIRTLHTVGLYGKMKLLSTSTGIPDEMRPQCLPPTQKTYFNSFTDLFHPIFAKPSARHFYVPKQKNHPAIDLYIPDHGIMLQITVGAKHPVKWHGIKKALDAKIFKAWQQNNPLLADPNAKPGDSPPDRKVRLVFLCDTSNFEDIKKQNWVGTDKDYKDAKTIAGCDELVEQFAWELNVETQLALNFGYQEVVRNRDKQILLAGQWGINDLDVPEPATKKRKR